MRRIRQLTRAAPVNTAKATSRLLAARCAKLLAGAGICALLAVAAFLTSGLTHPRPPRASHNPYNCPRALDLTTHPTAPPSVS